MTHGWKGIGKGPFVRTRALAWILGCVLIAAGCTPEGDAPGADDGALPQSPRIGPFEITGDCDGFGRLRDPQLSFVSGDRLFVAPSKGAVARCALQVRNRSTSSGVLRETGCIWATSGAMTGIESSHSRTIRSRSRGRAPRVVLSFSCLRDA